MNHKISQNIHNTDQLNILWRSVWIDIQLIETGALQGIIIPAFVRACICGVMPEYLTSRKSVAGGSPNHPMSIWLEVHTMSICNSLWRCEDIWPSMQPNGFRIQGFYLHPHNLHSVIFQTDFKGLQVEMGEIINPEESRYRMISRYVLLACPARGGRHWHSTNGDSNPNASVFRRTSVGVQQVFHGFSVRKAQILVPLDFDF